MTLSVSWRGFIQPGQSLGKKIAANERRLGKTRFFMEKDLSDF
tara:strand:- start:1365 stop:1493 length:129 start_codon:yes stop_codon:yes gene_type:complete